jgi:hypothetical protein
MKPSEKTVSDRKKRGAIRLSYARCLILRANEPLFTSGGGKLPRVAPFRVFRVFRGLMLSVSVPIAPVGTFGFAAIILSRIILSLFLTEKSGAQKFFLFFDTRSTEPDGVPCTV